MSFGEVCQVFGGRLGRAHTIADVPRHYYRDRLMDYIQRRVKEQDKQQAARIAICPDLTEGQLDEYDLLIAQNRQAKEDKARQEEEEERTMANQASYLMKVNKSIRTYTDAMKFVLQSAVMRNIPDMSDGELDQDKDTGITRNPSRPRLIDGSVIMPHWERLPSHVEPDHPLPSSLDKDCDQVRALIKRFITTTDWSLEGFRKALGNISRAQLVSFMEMRGTTKEQNRLAVYILSWEFFQRRRALDLPLSDTDSHLDYQVMVGNIDRKTGRFIDDLSDSDAADANLANAGLD